MVHLAENREVEFPKSRPQFIKRSRNLGPCSHRSKSTGRASRDCSHSREPPDRRLGIVALSAVDVSLSDVAIARGPRCSQPSWHKAPHRLRIRGLGPPVNGFLRCRYLGAEANHHLSAHGDAYVSDRFACFSGRSVTSVSIAHMQVVGGPRQFHVGQVSLLEENLAFTMS